MIEVLSPANTRAEIAAKRDLCLANGSVEFWTVDGKRKTITVARPGVTAIVYCDGDMIPLDSFGGSPLPVSPIFDIYSRTLYS